MRQTLTDAEKITIVNYFITDAGGWCGGILAFYRISSRLSCCAGPSPSPLNIFFCIHPTFSEYLVKRDVCLFVTLFRASGISLLQV